MISMPMYRQFEENTEYAYAVGRIRALETRLLDVTAISRLLEAESAPETLKILAEGEYESSLAEVRDPADFEAALNAEKERIYTLIDALSLDPDLTQLFRIRWDFHNLKVMLKSSYLEGSGPNGHEALIASGLIPVEVMRAFFGLDEEQGSIKLPDYIDDALESARAEYQESQNPQMIDIIIDNHLQSFLYERASDYPNSFLSGYFEVFADLANIKSFIRIKALGEGLRLLEASLIPHGSLRSEIFTRHFDETVENFPSALTSTPYAEMVAEGVRSWSEDHSLTAYERLSDNYLINYIKPAKYIVFGVEPLIGYLLAKEHEMKLIRIVMIGKLNDLPSEVIQERLRETYV